MKALWSGQLSAAKTGWLLALLFFGWLGYLLVPGPKPKPEPLPPFVVKPPSRLVALGLPDNPDLERLPELFVQYASQAEWQNNKTIFAYWNPYTTSYSHIFEATRTKGGYCFIAIDDPEAAEGNTNDASGNGWKDTEPEPSRLRFFYFGTHYAEYRDGWRTPGSPVYTLETEKPPRVVPDLNQKKVIVPPSDFKIQPSDLEQKHQ